MDRYQPDTEARSQDSYDRLYAQIDAELEAEWEAEFEGSFPYRSNGKTIHEAVMARSRG